LDSSAVISQGSYPKVTMSTSTAGPWKSIGSVHLMASSTTEAWKSVGSVHLQQSSSSSNSTAVVEPQPQITLDKMISSATAAPSPWKNRETGRILPSPTGSNVSVCVSDHDNTEAFVRFRKLLATLAQPTMVEAEEDYTESNRDYALA
jgi:hypothetical protein